MSKQAVVLIHGVGEQKPMETIRRFVETVWTLDESIHHPYAPAQLWSKPDDVAEGFELRESIPIRGRRETQDLYRLA